MVVARYIHVGNVYKLMKNNDEIFSLKKYKEAKVHIEKLEAILLVINKSIQAFTLFEAYNASGACLKTLKEQKIIVELQIAKCKAILETKGKL